VCFALDWQIRYFCRMVSLRTKLALHGNARLGNQTVLRK
jgi:hypothetical protein